MSDVSPLPQSWDLLLGFSETQGHSHIPRRKGLYFFIFFLLLGGELWCLCVYGFMYGHGCVLMCLWKPLVNDISSPQSFPLYFSR